MNIPAPQMGYLDVYLLNMHVLIAIMSKEYKNIQYTLITKK